MIHLKLLGVALLWAGTFIAGKEVATHLPHFTAATLRFWCAFAILAAVLLVSEKRWPRLSRRQLLLTGLLGLTGLFAYNLFFLGALERIPAGRTALIVALNPILTALAMALVFRERLAPHRWIGISLALLGVWIVLSKGQPALLMQRVGAGEALMVGAAMAWAAYTIAGRFVLEGEAPLSPLATTTVASLWGAVLLTLGMPFEWSQWSSAQLDAPAIGSVIYLGALGTALAFVWYYEGVKALGPARTAVFNNMVPVFGAAMATLLLDEPLLASMIVGGAVALAGVTLTNLQRQVARSTDISPRTER